MRRRWTWCSTIPHPSCCMVVLTMGVNVYLYIKVPKGFFPQQDTGRLQARSWASSTSPIRRWSRRRSGSRSRSASTRMSKPSPWWPAPAAADSAGNNANINVQLKPVGERKSSSDQVIARLRRKTSGVPGATMFLQNSQDVRIGGRQGNAQYQYTLQAPDFATLAEWGPKVLDQALAPCRKSPTSVPTSRTPAYRPM